MKMNENLIGFIRINKSEPVRKKFPIKIHESRLKINSILSESIRLNQTQSEISIQIDPIIDLKISKDSKIFQKILMNLI